MDAFNEVSKELFGHIAFQLKEGDEKWNAVRLQNRANAEALITDRLSERAVAVAAVKAAGYDTERNMRLEYQKLYQDARAELAKIKSNGHLPKHAQPDPGRRAPASASESARTSWEEALRAHNEVR